MGSSTKQIAEWFLRRPLQLETIRRELPESEDSDRLLRRVQRYRENLDAVVYALSSRKLAPDRREHLLDILRRHQQALEECLADLGLSRPPPIPHAPLWYYNQLDPVARTHLAAILGVPEEPPFYEVLDIKAEEYLSQREAFEHLTDKQGYRERQTLGRTTKRAALVLTLSGSLIQLSEPVSSRGGRRYCYQNIYGNAHPPEGVLVLDRDIRVGHRIRSLELTTSPVRLLRVVDRRVSWKAQSQTFERISRTLTSLVGRSAGTPGPLRAEATVQTGILRKANLTAAERVLREDYGESFASYRSLRQRFASETGDEGRKLEAELLTLCHYLQTAARELGFDAHPLFEVTEFETEEERVYRVDPDGGIVTLLSRSGGPDVQLIDVSVGRQLVTREAPLAFIGRDGGLVEITLPVRSIRRK